MLEKVVGEGFGERAKLRAGSDRSPEEWAERWWLGMGEVERQGVEGVTQAGAGCGRVRD